MAAKESGKWSKKVEKNVRKNRENGLCRITEILSSTLSIIKVGLIYKIMYSIYYIYCTAITYSFFVLLFIGFRGFRIGSVKTAVSIAD